MRRIERAQAFFVGGAPCISGNQFVDVQVEQFANHSGILPQHILHIGVYKEAVSGHRPELGYGALAGTVERETGSVDGTAAYKELFQRAGIAVQAVVHRQRRLQGHRHHLGATLVAAVTREHDGFAGIAAELADNVAQRRTDHVLLDRSPSLLLYVLFLGHGAAVHNQGVAPLAPPVKVNRPLAALAEVSHSVIAGGRLLQQPQIALFCF
ncbi:MAG: hypothetical protein IKP37_08890 [Paludibacteraceae bacterium]|nr:hypothetical protein [Paludibacteraceae bacterium]